MAMATSTSPRRSERLRNALLEGRAGFSPLLESASAATLKQCGACLLDIDTVSKDGDFVAILDSCAPAHFFHVRCIATWAAQENTCPLCKVRFGRFGVYGPEGDLRRVANVEERDQQEAEGDASDDDVVCSVCHRSDDEDALLLCDGLGGRCSGAAHFYCIGLPGVPEGDWFCSECQEIPLDSSQVDSQLQHPEEKAEEPVRSDGKEVKAPKTEVNREQAIQPKAQGVSSKRSLPHPVHPEVQSKKVKKEKVGDAEELKKEPEENKPGLSRSGSDVSKWIHWDGHLLQVELGGRRIKDGAAAAVAQLLRSVLEKCQARRPSVREVSFNLAGNRLGKDGLMVLLQAVESAGKHVACLDLEWNRIDACAAMWLASWIAKQSCSPRKLLLSHNRSIGDNAAQHLFQTVGRACVNKGATILPWIEAKYIGIKDPDTFLQLLSLHMNFCFALDRDACSLHHCSSREGEGEGGEKREKLPQLHLIGILEQRSQPLQPHSGAAKAEQGGESGADLSELHGVKSLAQERLKRPVSREAMKKEEFQPVEPDVEPSEPFTAASTTSQAAGVKHDRRNKHVSLDADIDAEREQRREWASSLGKSGVAVSETFDEDLPTPAPTRGMWDLVRAEAKKSQRQQKISRQSLSEGSGLKQKDRKDLGNGVQDDYKALKALVEARVRRKAELWKALTITESEQKLRQKCLVDELCKQVYEEGFKTALESGSWEDYLRTSIGHQWVLQWLDAKLSKAADACKTR
ncbi:unnamed protein product [Durusdinium trenchii]|uniref:PHD and RING finger domain-containing protein 1 n=2 Tax=Durusdinium trenchii TaxID=1381693 RepID=A0ABP0ND05_9DINO